jgi:two-component system chemotaxis response regulator CheB
MATNKVVLVEDSPVALEILQRLLNSSPDVDVVGTARNGIEGLDVINRTRPDVICTDFMMENMDGLEMTKRVMADDPRPILVISNFVQKTDIDNVFSLLQAGAADVFPKPSTDSPTDYERLKKALVTKIKVLSSMKVTAKRPGQSVSGSFKPTTSGAFSGNQPLMTNVSSRVKVIAIGASTGGLQAIQNIVCQLPSNFPLPIILAEDHIRLTPISFNDATPARSPLGCVFLPRRSPPCPPAPNPQRGPRVPQRGPHAPP